jgi:gluconolactonase
LTEQLTVEPVVLATDIGFTEGPVWTADARLLVVSMSRGLIYQVDANGGRVRPVAEPGAGPNGLVEDADGVLWVAQNGARHRESSSPRRAEPGIQRCTGDTVDDIEIDGVAAPNDCTVGPDGRLWFTDPDGPAFEPSDRRGRLWALDRASGTAEPMADGLEFPNGLAFLGDELYVAETRTRRILRFRLTAGGAGAPDVFANLGGSPDGMAFDVAGNLYVAAPDDDSVLVVSRQGEVYARIALGAGAFPTNVCFGGDGLRTLFVTAAGGGRVLALVREAPGLPLLPPEEAAA